MVELHVDTVDLLLTLYLFLKRITSVRVYTKVCFTSAKRILTIFGVDLSHLRDFKCFGKYTNLTLILTVGDSNHKTKVVLMFV